VHPCQLGEFAVSVLVRNAYSRCECGVARCVPSCGGESYFLARGAGWGAAIVRAARGDGRALHAAVAWVAGFANSHTGSKRPAGRCVGAAFGRGELFAHLARACA
jgi:hypothetical protein